MRNLEKREKILVVLAGVAVVVFVFNRFVCGKQTGNPAEIKKESVGATTQSGPRAPDADVVKKQLLSLVKRKIGPLTQFLSWGRDPFAEAFRLIPPDSSQSDSTDLVLRGIIWRGGEARALIGDEILKSGDRRGDLKILDIEKDRVICKKGGKIVTLFLESDVDF